MTNRHGDFIWYELLMSDADAAQAFYGDVIGWTVTDSSRAGIGINHPAASSGYDLVGSNSFDHLAG